MPKGGGINQKLKIQLTDIHMFDKIYRIMTLILTDVFLEKFGFFCIIPQLNMKQNVDGSKHFDRA